MSKIDEMLKNEKVEWRKLGEVCEFKRGQTITKKDVTNGEIPVIAGGQKPAYYHNISNRDGITIAVAGSGAYAGYVSYWECPIFLSDAFSVEPSRILDKRFLYHWLLSIQHKIFELKQGSGIPHVYGKDLAKFEIPIPSIETQEKIVKILDKFTNYVTELQAELQFRTKQYEYYRYMLLSEDYLNKISEKIEVVAKEGASKLYCTTLGDIGKICMCKRILKEQTFSNGEVPFYKIGTFGKSADAFISKQLFDEYKQKYNYPKKGEILISASGTIGKAIVFDGQDSYFQDSNIVWLSHDETKVLNRYLYYFYQIINWNPSTGGTISRLYNYNLVNIKITLPPIEIQNKVVKVLDKFQTLLEDTKGLLPTEIEQRRKQYEYYREKLLTFDADCGSQSVSQSVSQLISNSFFRILAEAADFVGIDINNNIEWKTLGSIGSFENGTGMPKTLFDEQGSVGAIHYGHIYTKYNKFVIEPIVKVSYENSSKLKKVKQGDLVIAKTSENLDDVMKTVAYIGIEDVVTGGHTAIFRHKENARYLAYVLNGTNYVRRQKDKMARGVKVIELSTSDMEKIKIPLPSIPVQEHIVSILDKFDTLVNDIKNGLPKEIELRQKQYEYFREKLLNFSK